MSVFRTEVVETDLKKDEFTLSVDFSKNYENKQRDEIQKAYFGHENFTIFPAACYFHETMMMPNSKLDVQFRLVVLPLAIAQMRQAMITMLSLVTTTP